MAFVGSCKQKYNDYRPRHLTTTVSLKHAIQRFACGHMPSWCSRVYVRGVASAIFTSDECSRLFKNRIRLFSDSTYLSSQNCITDLHWDVLVDFVCRLCLWVSFVGGAGVDGTPSSAVQSHLSRKFIQLALQPF